MTTMRVVGRNETANRDNSRVTLFGSEYRPTLVTRASRRLARER